MLRPYTQFLSSGRVFQNVRFYRIESVGRIRESPRGKMFFEFSQKRLAFGIAGELNRHATLVIRRSCRRRSKITAAQSTQPRQSRPSQLMDHGVLLALGRKK